MNGSQLNLCANGNLQSDFKCSLCEKFLSVAPIYNHTSGPICGRCELGNETENSQFARQTLYESLAKFLVFPCSNMTSSCDAQLKWGEVEEHENTCRHKKIDCPLSDCDWKGCGPDLNDHLEDCHTGHIQELPSINFTDISVNWIMLTRSSNQLMIVTIKCESPGRFSCMVMVNGISVDCDAYRYHLELSGANRTNSIFLRRDRLEDFVSIDQNLANLDKALVVEIPVIRSLLKDSETVLGRFVIKKKSKFEVSDSQQECFDDNILAELECSVCQNYMVSPIMICSSGHSFCQECKEQMDECPTCRGSFQGGRNYTLEKLTTSVHYPCINREAGCLVVCPGEKIKEHEQKCTASRTPCLLKCSSEPVINMFKHLKEKHKDMLFESGNILVVDVVHDESIFYVMLFGNDVFKLTMQREGGNIRLSVEQFAVNRSNHGFEIEIISQGNSSDMFYGGLRCSPLGDNLELSVRRLKRFISRKQIWFRISLNRRGSS